MKVARDFFASPADECERVIGCLQYCAFLHLFGDGTQVLSSPNTGEELGLILPHFEKGILYHGMISNLGDFPLLDQCFYITQKFTEFRERVEIIDLQIEFKDRDWDNLLLFALRRMKAVVEAQLTNAPLLKVFQILRLSDEFLMIFHLEKTTEEKLGRLIVVG